jgi:hypothetical protein
MYNTYEFANLPKYKISHVSLIRENVSIQGFRIGFVFSCADFLISKAGFF